MEENGEIKVEDSFEVENLGKNIIQTIAEPKRTDNDLQSIFTKYGISPTSHHMLACIIHNRLALLKFLVQDKNMTVDTTDVDGVTLILQACKHGHGEIVRYLVAQGADLNRAIKATSSNLFHLLSHNGDTELLQLIVLKLCGNDPELLKELIDEQKYYLPDELYFIIGEDCENGTNWEYIKIERTDLSLQLRKSHTGNNSFHYPSISDCGEDIGRIADCIFLELKECSIKDPEPVKDMTPLHIAVLKGHDDMAKMLVENGCDVNIKDCFGNTAAILAASNGNVELLEFLENNGAVMEETNDQNKNIEQVGRDNGHHCIVNFASGRDFLELTKVFVESQIGIQGLQESLSHEKIASLQDAEAKKQHITNSILILDNGILQFLEQLTVTKEDRLNLKNDSRSAMTKDERSPEDPDEEENDNACRVEGVDGNSLRVTDVSPVLSGADEFKAIQ